MEIRKREFRYMTCIAYTTIPIRIVLTNESPTIGRYGRFYHQKHKCYWLEFFSNHTSNLQYAKTFYRTRCLPAAKIVHLPTHLLVDCTFLILVDPIHKLSSCFCFAAQLYTHIVFSYVYTWCVIQQSRQFHLCSERFAPIRLHCVHFTYVCRLSFTLFLIQGERKSNGKSEQSKDKRAKFDRNREQNCKNDQTNILYSFFFVPCFLVQYCLMLHALGYCSYSWSEFFTCVRLGCERVCVCVRVCSKWSG